MTPDEASPLPGSRFPTTAHHFKSDATTQPYSLKGRPLNELTKQLNKANGHVRVFFRQQGRRVLAIAAVAV